MGKTYPGDLRDRVVASMASGGSCRDVAAIFEVVPSTAGNGFVVTSARTVVRRVRGAVTIVRSLQRSELDRRAAGNGAVCAAVRCSG